MQLDGRPMAIRLRDECLGARARHLSRVLTRRYDAALAPLGITTAQLEILGIVELTSPTRPAEIARLLDADRSTASRNIRIMLDNGWLAEEPAPTGRGKLVELTATGRNLLVAAEVRWNEAQRTTERELGPEAITTFDRWIATGREER